MRKRNCASKNRVFKFEDIGQKTISFLAEGLYRDARDPIREYIQNAVDANATDAALMVTDDSVIVVRAVTCNFGRMLKHLKKRR